MAGKEGVKNLDQMLKEFGAGKTRVGTTLLAPGGVPGSGAPWLSVSQGFPWGNAAGLLELLLNPTHPSADT